MSTSWTETEVWSAEEGGLRRGMVGGPFILF